MAQVLTLEKSQFHPGERAIHSLLRTPQQDNPTHHGLPPHLAYRIALSPLVALGAVDRLGRPWATIWGGEASFCQRIARGVLGVRATADAEHDPVLRALILGAADDAGDGEAWLDGTVVRPEGGALMAGLAIDLETRDRVKVAGRMVVGTATRTGAPGVADLQLALQVHESLGNCPKYLNRKRIAPHVPSPRLESGGKGTPLSPAAVELIRKADLFFIASRHGGESMDANHRGGAPGFMRVLRNTDADAEEGGGVAIVYPEYSGNRLYQTLGNLHLDPRAGLAIPDFETGDVLYLTGRTTILVGDKAARLMPHSKLAVRVDVDEARFVRDGLPFRGAMVDFSPYNPAVRPLVEERAAATATTTGTAEQKPELDGTVAMASLVSRQVLTPSISRYVFKLKGEAGGRRRGRPLEAWRSGHHVTLDFAPELDAGYSHMRDDDPLSLNDDFVRTFTVSRPLDANAVDGRGYVKERVEPEFEITVRRHGPATRLLERWNLRVPLEIPVLGFGGAEGFRMDTSMGGDGVGVFVAAGVGITPLMAQATDILGAVGGRERLRVLWSLKGEDLPLALDVLGSISGLGDVTKLFVTGKVGVDERASITTIQGSGARVTERRIDASDVLSEGEKGKRRFYCCTGPDLMRALLKWTEGEEVMYESFEY